MKRARWLGLFLVLGVVLAACRQDPQPPPDTNNITDVLAGEDFSTLLAAVQTAGLTDELEGAGPFTLFAPTNEAFEALPEGVRGALLADAEGLAELLSYHLLPTELNDEALAGADSFQETVQGAPVAVTVDDEGGVVLNNGPNVTGSGTDADNGIVYAIDSVLMLPATTFTAELSPENEVLTDDLPYDAIESDATGSVEATLNLEAETPTLAVTGTFEGLSSAPFPVGEGEDATAGHIHGPATVVENAGVLFPLSISGDGTETPATVSAAIALTPEAFGYLQNGLTYVNIHSENYQAGEIRGQLLPPAEQVPVTATAYVAELSPENEVLTDDLPYDSIQSDATGTVSITFDPEAVTLTAEGTFEGLSSELFPVGGTAGHIHRAPAGENGPVVFPLILTPDESGLSGTISGTTPPLTAEQIAVLQTEGFYVNIHTENYQAGELRGQIVPAEEASPTAAQ